MDAEKTIDDLYARLWREQDRSMALYACAASLAAFVLTLEKDEPLASYTGLIDQAKKRLIEAQAAYPTNDFLTSWRK